MRGLLTLLMAIAACTQVGAQQVSLAPSPAVRCLTPAVAERGVPEYPFDPWKRGEGGSVVVDLIFTTPDLRPQVDIVSQQGDGDFAAAVKAHVSNFRVPCLQYADIPVRLRQEYVFLPDGRTVSWTSPVDAADAQRRERLACIQRKGEPVYPLSARQRGLGGRVIVEARFVGPDQPPETKTYAVGRGDHFERSATDWVQALRLPCLGDAPITTLYTLIYRIEGDPAFGFKSLTLRELLSGVKDLRRQRVRFDTTQMGCPFELRLQYRQPFLPNAVGQVGEADPRRQPLIDWLSQVVLDLPDNLNESVFADIAPIAVSCIRIDLNPQEKS